MMLTAVLSSGCQSIGSDAAPPVRVAPEIPSYSPAFQARALDELRALPPACASSDPHPDCSALRVFVEDYGRLRAQLRGE